MTGTGGVDTFALAAAALALAAVVPVVAARPTRVPAPAPAPRSGPDAEPQPDSEHAGIRRLAFATALGRALRRLARLPPDAHADRFAGRATVATVVAAVVGSPMLAMVCLWGAIGWWAWSRRAFVRRREEAAIDLLPDLVDLFRVAVSAGCAPSEALAAVARHAPPAGRDALTAAVTEHQRGSPLADSLGALPRHLGSPAQPLATGIARSLRDGSPLADTLERLSSESRRARRRQGETKARRLPVTLLFPLVLCTLPAFALLTVVPLLLTSLQQLRF